MTSAAKPQPLTDPAQIAARTALANAGMGKSNTDPNVLALAIAFCRGEATFFGVPQDESSGRRSLIALFKALDIDAERMEDHYFTLLDIQEEN